MNKYDWSAVPSWVNWIATDKVAGEFISWGYANKPKINSGIWCDIDSPNPPFLIGHNIVKIKWQDSLEERPK